MIFGLFKRTAAPAAKPPKANVPAKAARAGQPPKMNVPAKAAPSSSRRTRPLVDLPPDPSALQVTEGSEHTDWALWEDSVAMLDSQMQSLQPHVKLYRHEPQTSTEFQEIEAFARVRRKDP